MSFMTKMTAMAAAGVAMVAIASPASAALEVEFPTGAVSGKFGDTTVALPKVARRRQPVTAAAG